MNAAVLPLLLHQVPLMRHSRPAAAPNGATRCSGCHLREANRACGLDATANDDIAITRTRLRRGESVLRAGAPFESLYAVRSGFFKSSIVLEDGRDQVTGFHMAGEILGMDGMATGFHGTDVVALEDSEVCIIPHERLDDPGMHAQLHRVMSRELVRDQAVMLLLGTMRAEERLAAFLLNLSQRFLARGYSPREFHLRMTREEIGSHIGLSLETVSRLFSRFQDEGLIAVNQKHVRILDVEGLKAAMRHRTRDDPLPTRKDDR